MNVLFFLTPKSEVAFVYNDYTVRQTLEKMEYHRYSSIPMLTRSGEYVGTITEGDLLWYIKKHHNLNIEQAEATPILAIPRKKDNAPVAVNVKIETLVSMAKRQNFIPVIDGKNSFIGIIKRMDIIDYCYNCYRESLSENQ